MLEGGHEFFAVEGGAFSTRDVIANFDHGRVIVRRHPAKARLVRM
jgi:hypothetical protein